MKTCPHCGESVLINISPERLVRLHKLFAAVKEAFGDKTFTCRQVVQLSHTKLDMYDAYQAWNDLRTSGLLKGLEGTMVYRKWQVNDNPLPPTV